MINRVVLVGRLTRNPEARGNSICTFSIAVDNFGKDADGNKTTSYIPCVVLNATRADSVKKYARKGMLVGVEGRLNQRSFKRPDDTKTSIIEVICDNVQFLEKKNQPIENEDMDYPYSDEDAGDVSNDADEPEQSGENKNLEGFDVTDDDLPF